MTKVSRLLALCMAVAPVLATAAETIMSAALEASA